MQRSCPIRRQGSSLRPHFSNPNAVLRPRRGIVRSPSATQQCLYCLGIKSEVLHNSGLTRSQEGRRQKRARRLAAAALNSSGWSPSESAPSRSEWLQAAKAQTTEVLLAALLSSEAVPLMRLPVLLTLVEGRPDLESCILAAGLPQVADALARSEMLQRLLPGGVLLEILSALVETRARDMTAVELSQIARMISAWQPPTSCELLGPAAAAVAAALVERCEGACEDAAVLAEALTVLRPWLEWRAAGDAGPAGGDFATIGGELSNVAAGAPADEIADVQGAVAMLLRSVSIRRAAEEPAAAAGLASEAAAAAEPATQAAAETVFGVLAAAVQYGVEVPAEFVKMAFTAASAPSAPPRLAAQLVALACCGSSGSSTRSSTSSSLTLTGGQVRDLVTLRLDVSSLDPSDQTAFLAALLAELREEGRRPSLPRAGRSTSTAAVKAADGLCAALGSAAGRLGPTGLALAMECVSETAAPSGAGAAAAAAAAAARQLLAAAAALVSRQQHGAKADGRWSPEVACRLAAAAVGLQRRGAAAAGNSGDGKAAAAEAAADACVVLAAVRAASVENVSLDAASALLAAAWQPVSSAKTPASELVLSGPVLDALLQRMAASASTKTSRPMRRRGGAQLPPAAAAAAAAATAAQPTPPLMYDQAEGVLAAVVAAAEAEAADAPSTSGATAAAAPPPPQSTISPARQALLRDAAAVACRALAPSVRQLDAAAAVRLLRLVARADEAGVRPDFPQLVWSLHERLRALAAADGLGPPAVLDVLRSCVALRWRPAVLLRDLLVPLLHRLQTQAEGDEQESRSSAAVWTAAAGLGSEPGSSETASAATAGAAATAAGRTEGLEAAARGDADGRSGGGGGARDWTPEEVKHALALIARMRLRGRLAEAVVKLGVGTLLRASAAAGKEARDAGAQLGAVDLSLLLWVCVATRYRGAAVLRPLLQQLLQVPPPQVPVKAVARAVWAAVRLDVVGERLVRWALASCGGGDKLATAPPQSLANLCWGLAKLGVRPPRTFVTAAAAAAGSHLPGFKPQELATLLFVLATWGGQLAGGAAEAERVVRHLVATRAAFDGPALCTAVWALQRLMVRPRTAEAVGTADGTETSQQASAGAAGSALDAEALRALEDRLLAANIVGDPRVGYPDHHLLRFFSACSAAGYRPERLLRRYVAQLQPRLRSVRGVPPATAPVAAEARSRMLWSAARILATFEVQDPELLASLELCAERCQSLLRPGHLAGLLAAMAALGHYPGRWAERGLLRRVGLALRSATLTEAALIMEAVGVWRPYLTAEAETQVADAAASDEAGPGNGPMAAAAAAEEEEGAEGVDEGDAAAGVHRLRAPTPQRVDLLRRVALARLTQLCAPQPPKPAPQPASQTPTVAGAASAPPLPTTTTSAAPAPELAVAPTSPAPASSPEAPVATSPSATATADGPNLDGDAAGISLDDAMRILTALARLRWGCPPVEAALLRVVARLPLERRRRVPELTTLMWALASLRQDVPELLDDLQAALLGLPPQPSLEAEMALMESGRVSAVRVAESSSGPVATAAMAAAATTAPAGPRAMSAAAAAVVVPPVEATGAAQGLGPAPQGSDNQGFVPSSAPSQTAAAAAAIVGSDSGVPRVSGSASGDAGGPGSSTDGGEAAAAAVGTAGGDGSGTAGFAAVPRVEVQLLSRPAKPVAPTGGPADAGTAGSTADGAGGGASAAAASFDPAAAMVAAAAEVNQRYEQQLVGPMGQSQLPSEPWSPADIFKTMWSCAKMNRHPGPLILAAAERSWLSYTADGVGVAGASGAAADAPPLHTITGLLWSLSVFRHHNGTFARRLAEQLAMWARDGDMRAAAGESVGAGAAASSAQGMEDTEVDAEDAEAAAERRRQHLNLREQQQQQQQRMQALYKQGVQLAACLLAAQADRVDSPLNTALPPEVRARLVAAWRSRLAQRLAKPPNRYQADLVSVLRKMGVPAAANVATPDGCALVDVAVALRPPPAPASSSSGPGAPPPPAPPPRLLALELLGRHNTAANNPRILGEAVIKYRLLQARGYLVVPIPCYEWDRIDHKDVWTKMVYLQAKIDRRTGGLSAGSAPLSVMAAAAVATAAGSASNAASAAPAGMLPSAGSTGARAGTAAVTGVDAAGSSGRGSSAANGRNGSKGGDGATNGGNGRPAAAAAAGTMLEGGGQQVNVMSAGRERGGASNGSSSGGGGGGGGGTAAGSSMML